MHCIIELHHIKHASFEVEKWKVAADTDKKEAKQQLVLEKDETVKKGPLPLVILVNMLKDFNSATEQICSSSNCISEVMDRCSVQWCAVCRVQYVLLQQ